MSLRHPRRASRDQETRARLLDAASSLFAAHGYQGVTVRALCREARANLAAVNYHFGDKLGLYKEVVAAAIALARRGAAPEAPPGTAPEERLRAYVRGFLPRVARPEGPASQVVALLQHEMQDPTPLASWVARQAIFPRLRLLAGIVAELLGRPPADPLVERCALSVQAQVVFYVPNRFRSAVFPAWAETTPAELEAIARDVAELSLAGIRRLAETGGTDLPAAPHPGWLAVLEEGGRAEP